jgi:hypothetical protein
MKCASTSLSVQLSPIFAYLALCAGLFWLHSAWAALLGFQAVIIISLLIHGFSEKDFDSACHSEERSDEESPRRVANCRPWTRFFAPQAPLRMTAGGEESKTLSKHLYRPNIPIALLFKSKHIKWIILSVLLCGSSGIILYFLWPIFGIANDLPAQLQSLGLASFTWSAFIAYFSLVNPLIEEYFWRGFLGSNSKNLYASDPLYAGYHALILWGKVHPFSILFAVILLTILGWSWRQIAREDDGLFAPVLGHMAADLSITLCVYLMCK